MICPKCQAQNLEGSRFCVNCGANLTSASVTPSPTPPQTPSTGLPQNTAGALCYLFGFITGIIFLLIEKENRFIRFHAMQSIITSGALLVLNIVPGVFFGLLPFSPELNMGGMIRFVLGPIINIPGFILWIVLMIKAYQGEMYKLPIVGDLAEKQI